MNLMVFPYRSEVHRDLGAPAAPGPTAHAIEALSRAVEFERLGHADFVHLAPELAATARARTDMETVYVTVSDATVADPEGSLAGVIICGLPQQENTDVIHLEALIRPGVDAGAVLQAALPDVDEVRAGRPHLLWDEYARLVTPGEGIVAATGAGALEPTPVSRWLLGRGFVLEQTVVVATMTLGDDLDPGPLPPGYRLRWWIGPVPLELREDLAQLKEQMSRDVPSRDHDLEDEVWDEVRLDRETRVVEAAGRKQAWTVMLAPDGRVVGYTSIEFYFTEPREYAHQDDTFVVAAERGRGFALAMKKANATQLRGEDPDIARVHTFNARENHWMIAINRTLGYTSADGLGHWSGHWCASAD